MENLLTGGPSVLTINPNGLCWWEWINVPLKGMTMLSKIVLEKKSASNPFSS